MSLIDEIRDSLNDYPGDWEIASNFIIHNKYLISISANCGDIYAGSKVINSSLMERMSAKTLAKNHINTVKKTQQKQYNTLQDFGTR